MFVCLLGASGASTGWNHSMILQFRQNASSIVSVCKSVIRLCRAEKILSRAILFNCRQLRPWQHLRPCWPIQSRQQLNLGSSCNLSGSWNHGNSCTLGGSCNLGGSYDLDISCDLGGSCNLGNSWGLGGNYALCSICNPDSPCDLGSCCYHGSNFNPDSQVSNCHLGGRWNLNNKCDLGSSCGLVGSWPATGLPAQPTLGSCLQHLSESFNNFTVWRRLSETEWFGRDMMRMTNMDDETQWEWREWLQGSQPGESDMLHWGTWEGFQHLDWCK